MSFLKSHGHVQAHLYPVGMLLDELGMCQTQVSREIALRGLVIKTALGTVPSMGVDAKYTKAKLKEFSELISGLMGE